MLAVFIPTCLPTSLYYDSLSALYANGGVLLLVINLFVDLFDSILSVMCCFLLASSLFPSASLLLLSCPSTTSLLYPYSIPLLRLYFFFSPIRLYLLYV
jgi:hypothetical protein